MPSNVRRHDKSCQAVWNQNTKVYKCKTCDPNQLLVICKNCFIDGKHYGHDFSKIVSNNGFCNCGDLTGLVYCLNHDKVMIADISKPLHVNDIGMKEFCQITGITLNEAQDLAQLNQIRKLYYKSSDGKLIKKYLDNSITQGSQNLNIKKSYSVYRKDHEIRFVNSGYHKQRRVLLWHGTKGANVKGILSEGFKLPPNGGMFGKGVYFADRVSKSSNYCDQSGLLFLCEVALGSMWRTSISKQYTSPPKSQLQQYHSVKGLGNSIPDKSGQTIFDGDIIVPTGKSTPNPNIKGSALAYNEFIVFNVDRILIKFIVQFDWA